MASPCFCSTSPCCTVQIRIETGSVIGTFAQIATAAGAAGGNLGAVRKSGPTKQ